MTTGPLAGCRIVELGGIGPGPFAGMLLADLGAEVVRIDRPEQLNDPDAGGPADVINRGKRSAVIDLKHPDGAATVLGLIDRADALIEGFRPGVTERLGIGPHECLARNPRLVYGRMTGWGQDGPLSAAAGHDIGYIALTGALGAIGDAGGPPQIPLNLLGDFGGGACYLVIGILAALHAAQRTGHGQVVDAAIVDGTTHLLASPLAKLARGAWTDERGVNQLDGGWPFYAVYATRDGRHMAVGALEAKFYRQLIELLELDVDPEHQHDRSTWPELKSQLTQRFAERTRDEWAALFEGTDACVAPVLGLTEAARHPHLAARASLLTRDGVVQPNAAPRFSATPATPGAAAPRVGTDTAQVLRDWGIENVDALITGGAAHCADNTANREPNSPARGQIS
ncbi:CaiB/BaiF CoA transferase family protein [Nocardia macrotermitis]|uniref:Acetyl-CoA:oxalate CoA-transferase n=1 Tax=Nocardia macrotermitis TaxID=2585198 RepID=A0A7K0D751_9NOCA|nr:CaiB/BaiF CoA-transferase family protein [Nocardia macrotermitis]MQY21489.1 Acetyl-CoA:oxalate CoA-transferase [Nocardia macrotermitis]